MSWLLEFLSQRLSDFVSLFLGVCDSKSIVVTPTKYFQNRKAIIHVELSQTNAGYKPPINKAKRNRDVGHFILKF